MLLLKSFIYVEKKSYCNGSTILSLNSKNSFNFDHTLILSSNKIIMLDYFSTLMLKIHLALRFDLILALCSGPMCTLSQSLHNYTGPGLGQNAGLGEF